MTVALTAALVLTVLVMGLLLDRKDRRHASMVMDLCQRIQAPDVAVAQHASFGPDEETPVSEYELEDEEREAIERMERIEREQAPWLS